MCQDLLSIYYVPGMEQCSSICNFQLVLMTELEIISYYQRVIFEISYLILSLFQAKHARLICLNIMDFTPFTFLTTFSVLYFVSFLS